MSHRWMAILRPDNSVAATSDVISSSELLPPTPPSSPHPPTYPPTRPPPPPDNTGCQPHEASRRPVHEGIIANGAERSLSLMAVNVFSPAFIHDLKSLICRRVLLAALSPRRAFQHWQTGTVASARAQIGSSHFFFDIVIVSLKSATLNVFSAH